MSTSLKPFVGATHTTSTTIEAGEQLPEHLATYSSELGVSPNRKRERVYNELRIEPGDEVYVIGKAKGVTGTEYPSRATRVVSNGDSVNVIVQEPYEVVDEAFDSFRSYYLYGAAVAAFCGYSVMVLLMLW